MATKDELEAQLDEALHKLDLAEKREARLKDKLAESKDEAPKDEAVEAPEASLDALEAMANDLLAAGPAERVIPHLNSVKRAVEAARDALEADASQVRP